MKAKINIEIWDKTKPEKLDDVGITDKFLFTLYHSIFKDYLDKNFADGGCEYSLNVEITDEVTG